MIEHFKPFLQRCISLDLEVDPTTAAIFAFAAVRDDSSTSIVAKKRDLVIALDRLEADIADADYLIGHNILRHDLPHLLAVWPAEHLWLAAMRGSCAGERRRCM